MKTIKVKIGKDGTATVLTEGFTGKGCVEETESLEIQLGRAVREEKTSEYYKPEAPTDTWVRGS